MRWTFPGCWASAASGVPRMARARTARRETSFICLLPARGPPARRPRRRGAAPSRRCIAYTAAQPDSWASRFATSLGRLQLRWFTPVGGLLVGVANPENAPLLPRPPHDLDSHGQSVAAPARRHREGGIAGHAYGIAVLDEREEGVDLLAQELHLRVLADLGRRERRDRRDERVH